MFGGGHQYKTGIQGNMQNRPFQNNAIGGMGNFAPMNQNGVGNMRSPFGNHNGPTVGMQGPTMGGQNQNRMNMRSQKEKISRQLMDTGILKICSSVEAKPRNK